MDNFFTVMDGDNKHDKEAKNEIVGRRERCFE